MSSTIEVDIFIQGFNIYQNFKIFNLDMYRNLNDIIILENHLGMKTSIYTDIQR